MADRRLVLGSASPRRSALLDQLGIKFEIATAELDEDRYLIDRDAVSSVQAIARAKYDVLSNHVGDVTLLTADTLVSCNGTIMGKPESDAKLKDMLSAMSGQSLTIATAICVGAAGSAPASHIVRTIVKLRVLSDSEIVQYVATEAGMDKAGGLALQAEAASFIAGVDGCWSNVLGLPVCAVSAALAQTPGGDQASRCSIDLCGSAG